MVACILGYRVPVHEVDVPFYILILLLQIALAVHVARTGRNLYWIMIIVLVPVVGAAAYFLVEVLPDLQQSRGARRAAKTVRSAFDSTRQRRELEAKLALSDTVRNRVALADECLHLGEHRRAADLYRSCLKGRNETDPDLMLSLAQAQFAGGDAAAARATLEALIAANPGFRSEQGHMLYARSLESLGEREAALHEYAALAEAYAGEEGRGRYAALLEQSGRIDEARAVQRETLTRARLAPRHYREANREWIERAERALEERA